MSHALRSFYESAWQHPGVALAGGAIVLAAALVRPPRPRALLLVLEAEILVDAWWTGAWSPDPTAAWPAALFVVCGDWRFFFLVFRQRAGRAAALASSLAWSFAVPAASFALRSLWARARADEHVLFCAYEAAFALVALGFATWIRRRFHGPVGRWLLGLAAFEVIQYSAWAVADALILSGHELGWALRVVPNTLYYVAFVPFAVFRAPVEAQA